MNARKRRRLAERIADELFVNGMGWEAARLMLVSTGGKDFGGWCKSSVITVIERELELTDARENPPLRARRG